MQINRNVLIGTAAFLINAGALTANEYVFSDPSRAQKYGTAMIGFDAVAVCFLTERIMRAAGKKAREVAYTIGNAIADYRESNSAECIPAGEMPARNELIEPRVAFYRQYGVSVVVPDASLIDARFARDKGEPQPFEIPMRKSPEGVWEPVLE